jgi:hypothetical protein
VDARHGCDCDSRERTTMKELTKSELPDGGLGP